MIQLKSLIKEEVLNENMVSVLKPPVRKAKSTIYGYINLQYHAVPLIKSMREFLKLVFKPYLKKMYKTKIRRIYSTTLFKLKTLDIIIDNNILIFIKILK